MFRTVATAAATALLATVALTVAVALTIAATTPAHAATTTYRAAKTVTLDGDRTTVFVQWTGTRKRQTPTQLGHYGTAKVKSMTTTWYGCKGKMLKRVTVTYPAGVVRGGVIEKGEKTLKACTVRAIVRTPEGKSTGTTLKLSAGKRQ